MSHQVDLTVINYFLPIFAFLLVAALTIAIIMKTQLLGKGKGWAVFVGLVIATIFVAMGGTRDYVTTIVPWFAVLFVALFLVLLMLGFVGKFNDRFYKGIGIIFLIALFLVFIISGFFVYSDVLVGYLPGPNYGYTMNPDGLWFTDWLYSPRIVGAIVLLAVSALVAWVITKK